MAGDGRMGVSGASIGREVELRPEDGRLGGEIVYRSIF